MTISTEAKFWVDLELQWQQLREILFPLASRRDVLSWELIFKDHYDQGIAISKAPINSLVIALHEAGEPDLYNKAVEILEKCDTLYLAYGAEVYRLQRLDEENMLAIERDF